MKAHQNNPALTLVDRLTAVIDAALSAEIPEEKKQAANIWFSWFDSFVESAGAIDDAEQHERLCSAMAQAMTTAQQEKLLNRFCAEREAELKEVEARMEKIRDQANRAGDKTDRTVFSLSDDDTAVSLWRVMLIQMVDAMRPDELLRPRIEALLKKADTGFNLTACRLLGNMGERAWASWPAMHSFLRTRANGPALATAIIASLAADPTRLPIIEEALRDDCGLSRTGLLTIIGQLSEMPETAHGWPWPETLRELVFDYLQAKPADDVEADLQGAAFGALAGMGIRHDEMAVITELVGLVTRGIESPYWFIRAAAISCAGRLRLAPETLVPLIASRLEDDEGCDGTVAGRALQALSRYECVVRRAGTTLQRLLHDPEYEDYGKGQARRKKLIRRFREQTGLSD